MIRIFMYKAAPAWAGNVSGRQSLFAAEYGGAPVADDLRQVAP
jgi:hypothetical protein